MYTFTTHINIFTTRNNKATSPLLLYTIVYAISPGVVPLTSGQFPYKVIRGPSV